MSPSAPNLDAGVNGIAANRIQSLKLQHKDFGESSVALQELDRHNSGNKVIPLPEDASAGRATEDLEASYQATATPAYSVFNDRQRKSIIFMVACAGFFSTLSANIYFPALNALSRDLKVSNGLINLTLTSYMIFQGLAPTVFGDLADMVGRRPAYILGFTIYIGTPLHHLTLRFWLMPQLGANIGLALKNNYAALLVLRCLQSSGSSGTVALGSGVVTDIASSGERGRFMAMFIFVCA